MKAVSAGRRFCQDMLGISPEVVENVAAWGKNMDAVCLEERTHTLEITTACPRLLETSWKTAGCVERSPLVQVPVINWK
jgi:hypothetical protein